MADEELIEELDGMLWRIEGNYHREGAGPGSRFEGQTLQTIQARALVRRIREWLAERGRLLPDGGLTRTEWAVTTPRGKQIHYVYDEVEARTCAIYGPRRIPVSRQVTNWPDGTMLTTRWVPVPDDTWRPAKPGETPGALVPGEGDVPQPVDLPAPVGVPVPDNTGKEVGDVET